MRRLALSLMLLTVAVTAENLLRNASFEVVAQDVISPGYNRYGPLRDPVLRQVVESPIEQQGGEDAIIDLMEEELQADGPRTGWRLVRGPQAAWHGELALLGNLKESYPLALETEGGAHVFSVYAKSKGTDVLQLRVEDIRGRKGEIRHEQKKAFTLSDEWQRCVFPVRTQQGPVTLYLDLLGQGTVYVDAVQFEAGTEASAFELHPWDLAEPRDIARHGEPLYPAEIQRVRIEYVETVLQGIAEAPQAALEAPGQAGELPLRLGVPEQTPAGLIPVTGGVPLPLGQLFDPDQAIVVDAAGDVVPSQLRVLSRHIRDGSVQMLLIDLQAADPAATYTLRWGPEIRRKESNTPLSVETTTTGLEVKTGPLRFVVGQSSNAIEQLWYDSDGDGSFAETEQVLKPTAAQGAWTHDPLGRLYWGSNQPEVLRVEESGPLRCSILMSGAHRSEEGQVLFRYSIRLHAYSGKPYIRLEHTFTNEQQPYSTVMTGAGLRLAVREGVFSKLVANDDMTLFLAPANDAISLVDGVGLHRRRGDNVQQQDLQTPGWITLQGERLALTAMIREWAWMPPKEFHWDPETGLDLCIWPRHLTSGLAVPRGMSRSHRMWVSFHAPEEDTAALRSWFAEESLVQTSPEIYCDSTVFGKLAVKDSERFPAFETFIQREGEGIFGRFPRPGEYNWSGDFVHHGDDRGDMGFGNLETMLDHCMWLLYVRSLDPWYYRRAFDAVLHYRDVDMCHPWGQARVHSHNHTLIPWDCSHSWIKGILEHYLLTGDNRSLEVAHQHGRWLLSVPTAYKVSTGSRRWTRIVQNLADLYRITGHAAYYDSFVARLELAEDLRGDNRTTSLFQLDNLEKDQTSYGRIGMQQVYGMGGLEEMAKTTGDARWRDLLLEELRFLLASQETQAPLTDRDAVVAWGRETGRQISSARSRLYYTLMGYAFDQTGDQRWLDAMLNSAYFETTRSDWKDWYPNLHWSGNVLAAHAIYYAQEMGLGAEFEDEIRSEAIGGGLPKKLLDPGFESSSMRPWAAGKEVYAARAFDYMEVFKDPEMAVEGAQSISIQETRMIGTTRELDRSKRALPLDLTGNQFLVEEPGWYRLSGHVRVRKNGRPNVVIAIDPVANNERFTLDARLPERLPPVRYPDMLGLDGNAPQMGESIKPEEKVEGVDLQAFTDEVSGHVEPLDPDSVWWRFELPFEVTAPGKVRVILQYVYGLRPPGQVWFDNFNLELMAEAPESAEATIQPILEP